MRHMIKINNLCLIATRRTVDAWGILSTRNIVAHKACAAYDINNIFPLYVYSKKTSVNIAWTPDEQNRIPNLNPEVVNTLEKLLRLKFSSSGKGDLQTTFGPEDIFHYIYAVLHSPTYRARYAQFLKADFPRVPLTSDKKLFAALCGLGRELAAYHLLESKNLTPSNFITGYPVSSKADDADTVASGYPKYVSPKEKPPKAEDPLEKGRVYINKTQYFEGVSPDVWAFQVGGYQVAEKWLKDRKGRKLSYQDQEHYQKIILALHETIRLMKEIDRAVPQWPIQ